MIDVVTWLHISDFHFVSEGDQFSQQEATAALLRDAPERIDDAASISFVLVSGDVAYSGQPDQYERASEFLSELALKIDVPRDHFYFVPGNHDVDRDRCVLSFEGACKVLTSRQAVDHWLARPDELGTLLERQAMFWAFVEEFTAGQDRSATDDGLGYVAPIQLGTVRACVLGLNSAWLSGRDAEEMKLLIGERQMLNALRLAEDLRPQLQVAIAHHPISWLHEWDQDSCRLRLLPQVDFYHRGHLHQPEVSLSSSPERPCLSVAAGSGHATRFYENSYNLMALDLGAGLCTVRAFRFEPQAGSYGPADETSWQFTLGGSLPGGIRELAAVFGALGPATASYCGYLAALVAGQQAEVPVQVESNIEFVTEVVATELSRVEELVDATAFLRLRNLLRLYDEQVPLSTRVEDHRPVAEAFAAHLSNLADANPVVRHQLELRHASALRVAGASTATERPHARAFLLDLHRAGDWELLEAQARRFAEGSDPDLSRISRALLAEALMHSDEHEKRREAMSVATELTDHDDATVDDYLRAAGAAEVMGDDPNAVDFARRALEAWPNDGNLRKYVRGLVSRSGDVALRRDLDATETRVGES